MRTIIILIFFTIGYSILTAYSEIGEPFIRNFEPKEYGGHLQVFCIAQDQRGVMIFGTTNSIVQFDGGNWRRLELPNRSIIRSLTVAREGTIYVGAQEEFGFLASDHQGQLIYRSLLDQLPKSNGNIGTAWEVHATSHGIYFVTQTKIFRWYQNKISTLVIARGSWSFKVDDDIFFIDKTGILRLKQGNLDPLPFTGFFQDFGVSMILPFKEKSQILIITRKKGCYLYDTKGKGQSSDMIVRKFPTQLNQFFSQNVPYKGIKLNNNDYAISTMKGGIVIMNSAGRLVRIVNETRGLLNNFVFRVFQDQSNNLWAGMQGGIAYIESSSPVSRFGKRSGIRSTTLSVTRHQGQIYAGTFNEAPLRLNHKLLKHGDEFYEFSSIDNFEGDQIWGFLSFGKKLLVASTSVFVVSDNVVTKIKGTDEPYCFHQNKKFPNIVFVGFGSPGSGLGMIEQEKGGFKFMGKVPDIDQDIYQIISDSQDNLWLATTLSGLIHICFKGKDIRDMEITRYTKDHGLPEMAKLQLLWDKDRLLVGTSGNGIYSAVPINTDFRKRYER